MTPARSSPDAYLGPEVGQHHPVGTARIRATRKCKTGHRTAQPLTSPAGQTGPELGFSLNAWPGRRDAAPSIKDGPSNCCEGGAAAMTDRSHEIIPQDDLRILVRVVSACTLGLWAFAAGLLIGVFLFS